MVINILVIDIWVINILVIDIWIIDILVFDVLGIMGKRGEGMLCRGGRDSPFFRQKNISGAQLISEAAKETVVDFRNDIPEQWVTSETAMENGRMGSGRVRNSMDGEQQG